MKTDRMLVFVTAVILAGSVPLFADATNKYDLRVLAQRHLPGCQFRVDATGKTESLVSATGEVLELATAARDHPQPTNGVIGYWFSPNMSFLSRQQPKVATPEEAVGLVQLMHALWRGPAFVQQKIYSTRPFDGGWVIQVEHNFTNHPESVQAIQPYELLVDEAGRVVQFRERCYFYQGSAVVYTNTVISVYEREIKRNRGRDYPEVLFEELRTAWEKEKEQKSVTPQKTRSKE
jgi:hypothetical protein